MRSLSIAMTAFAVLLSCQSEDDEQATKFPEKVNAVSQPSNQESGAPVMTFVLTNYIVVEVEVAEGDPKPVYLEGRDESDIFKPPCSDLKIVRPGGTMLITDRGTNNESIVVDGKEMLGMGFRVDLNGNIVAIDPGPHPILDTLSKEPNGDSQE